MLTRMEKYKSTALQLGHITYHRCSHLSERYKDLYVISYATKDKLWSQFYTLSSGGRGGSVGNKVFEAVLGPWYDLVLVDCKSCPYTTVQLC